MLTDCVLNSWSFAAFAVFLQRSADLLRHLLLRFLASKAQFVACLGKKKTETDQSFTIIPKLQSSQKKFNISVDGLITPLYCINVGSVKYKLHLKAAQYNTMKALLYITTRGQKLETFKDTRGVTSHQKSVFLQFLLVASKSCFAEVKTFITHSLSLLSHIYRANHD